MHRTIKSVISIIGALGGVAYCGGLIYYFIDVTGSMQEAKDQGLGPTLMGLGAVGGLFCVAFLVRIVLLFLRRRPPGSNGRSGPDAPPPKGKGGFDADAAFERYMAQRPAETISGAPAPSSMRNSGPARSGFGRKQ